MTIILYVPEVSVNALPLRQVVFPKEKVRTMAEVSPVDRLAVEDALGRYLLAVDRGDHAGVCACFAPQATVLYGDGRQFSGADGIAAFARSAIAGPEARQRMHLCRSLFAEPLGDAIVLRSYLIVPQAGGPGEPAQICTMRYVEDTYERSAGRWLIARRVIHPWPLPQATPPNAEGMLP
jgi:ketosteroid isomerase-like protein